MIPKSGYRFSEKTMRQQEARAASGGSCMGRFKYFAAAAAVFGLFASAHAQELKIGLSAEPSAMDPHFHNLAPNHALTKHIFDALTDQDETQRLKPGLALSWRPVDGTTWEFKLRPGVKFTDGSELTANDVIYTFCRAPRVENSPSSLALNVRAVVDMAAPDPLTVIMKTEAPYPLLPSDIVNVRILSAKANGAGTVTFGRQECQGVGTYPKTDAFNSGQAAIGTGPYKLV